jgi:hypothetical protein
MSRASVEWLYSIRCPVVFVFGQTSNHLTPIEFKLQSLWNLQSILFGRIPCHVKIRCDWSCPRTLDLKSPLNDLVQTRELQAKRLKRMALRVMGWRYWPKSFRSIQKETTSNGGDWQGSCEKYLWDLLAPVASSNVRILIKQMNQRPVTSHVLWFMLS